MKVEVTMPNLGYDMEEGKVAAWLKAQGDDIQRGEAIAEIETDKATVEMEVSRAGHSPRSSPSRATRSRSAA